MARPKRSRTITGFPEYNMFVPDGIPQRGYIELELDEFEVIRLIDYKSYTHAKCADKMNISRTTVTEIYARARKKIARSIMEGYPLRIEGNECIKKTGYPVLKVKGEHIMRIAVTYENESVFPHFGKTSQFKLYDVENNEIKESQVVGTEGLGHGALAILLSNMNVDVLICGGIGRGAIMALSGSDINVVGGVTGDCDTAVKAYLDGTLVTESEPTCGCSHDSCECHDE